MAAIDMIRTSNAAGNTGGASLFTSVFGLFAAWSDAYKTRAALSALSDRELDDIGLSRQEIDRVAGY